MKDVVHAGQEAGAEVSGLGETRAFSILATAKAFKILISQLYSDPIQAIIRELSTNAFDSHIAANKEELPFVWQLPTRFEPTFRCRDFGTGLSHDDIMGLYTTVFASTKEQDNSAVGKFGLGSKVPFAYADTFGVTVWMDGVQRIYSVFMDKGMPMITLFAEEPSDEPTGLEVSFPVKSTDVEAFKQAARRVAFGFDVQPKCNVDISHGATTLFSGTRDATIAGSGARPGWTLYGNTYGLGIEQFMVRQGCVLYPVNRSTLSAFRRSDAIEALYDSVIVLDMPIGSVEITPSRESLSYDETTMTNLLDAIDGVFDQFADNANQEIAQQPSLYEAMKARGRMLAGISNSKLKEFVGRRTMWHRKKLAGNFIMLDFKRMASLERRGIKMAAIHTERKRGRTKATVAHMGSFSVDVTKPFPAFAYYTSEEAPSYVSYRAEAAYVHFGGQREVILLRNFKPGCAGEKALYASLGRPASEKLEFVDLLTIPFVKPDYKKTLVGARVWDDQRDVFEIPSQNGRVLPSPTDTDVYYCHTFKNEPKRGDRELGTSTVSFIFDNFRRLGFISKFAKLVGIPASCKAMAKNMPADWIDLFEFFHETLQSEFDPAAASLATALSSLNGNHVATAVQALFKLLNDHEGLIQDKSSISLEVQLEALPFFDANANGERHMTLHTMVVSGGALFPEEREALLAGYDPAPVQKAFWAIVERHRAAYPLLHRLSVARDSKDVGDLIDYINLRDVKFRVMKVMEEARQEAEALAAFEGEGGMCLLSDINADSDQISLPSNVILLDSRKVA